MRPVPFTRVLPLDGLDASFLPVGRPPGLCQCVAKGIENPAHAYEYLGIQVLRNCTVGCIEMDGSGGESMCT